MERYEPQKIEKKWQAVWAAEKAFHVQNPPPGAMPDKSRKSYVLEMLPYPSGTLHMGHVLVYTLGDILAHFRRRNGMTVLRPMGFDSFGLPSENAAIREGGHPREITERNIEAIRASMKRIGWAIDWDRELSTHLPEYYEWTQWVFLRFFEQGHAYRANAPVKWCPKDQTVLANEQVKDGRCERCGSEVVSKNLEQWFFRITPYADQLLDDMADLDWPERVLAMQRHWIGRSEGAEVLFRIEELDVDVPVFTTRPDTLFGATFFVLAPEHELVDRLDSEEVREYVRRGVAKKGEERAAAEEKTGVFTGWHATNPVNGERIPVWVADYVLMEYGTGAIMAVPSHDERDREFAEAFDLPIREVIDEDGVLVNSGEFEGLPHEEAKKRIVEWLAEQGKGRPAVNFRLRDWLLSRQRYWGCPIPIVHCDECGPVAVPDDQLPVVLPEIRDYMPKGVSPLATAEEWVNVDCPSCGRPGRREVDTMDTFVDSSWYFIRYCDPDNTEAPWDRELADFWGPVDQYTGGVDHATMHLIYARYFCKALTDMGLLGYREPFLNFFGNGWVQMGQVKMSKRAGNIVGPEQLVEEYGADAVRMYILFIGPADQDMEWTEGGLEGMARFVRRLWRVVHEVCEGGSEGEPGDGPLARKTHETIARVTDDLGRRRSFNTAISAVMELVNELSPRPDDQAARFAAETAVSLIQPYAPHVAEELWETLGHERLWSEPWRVADPALLRRDTFELVVQVNGKVRDRVEVPADLSEDDLIERAKTSPKVRAMLDGKKIQQTIVVPRKLVNIVLPREDSP
jgi:leucyl-tRNA synthetase